MSFGQQLYGLDVAKLQLFRKNMQIDRFDWFRDQFNANVNCKLQSIRRLEIVLHGVHTMPAKLLKDPAFSYLSIMANKLCALDSLCLIHTSKSSSFTLPNFLRFNLHKDAAIDFRYMQSRCGAKSLKIDLDWLKDFVGTNKFKSYEFRVHELAV